MGFCIKCAHQTLLLYKFKYQGYIPDCMYLGSTESESNMRYINSVRNTHWWKVEWIPFYKISNPIKILMMKTIFVMVQSKITYLFTLKLYIILSEMLLINFWFTRKKIKIRGFQWNFTTHELYLENYWEKRNFNEARNTNSIIFEKDDRSHSNSKT